MMSRTDHPSTTRPRISTAPNQGLRGEETPKPMVATEIEMKAKSQMLTLDEIMTAGRNGVLETGPSIKTWKMIKMTHVSRTGKTHIQGQNSRSLGSGRIMAKLLKRPSEITTGQVTGDVIELAIGTGIAPTSPRPTLNGWMLQSLKNPSRSIPRKTFSAGKRE